MTCLAWPLTQGTVEPVAGLLLCLLTPSAFEAAEETVWPPTQGRVGPVAGLLLCCVKSQSF